MPWYELSLPSIFPQVVWKNTKQIGAAQQKRKDGRLVVVIRYSPPGNFFNAFRENVLPARTSDPDENGVGQIRSSSALTAFVIALGAVFKFIF